MEISSTDARIIAALLDIAAGNSCPGEGIYINGLGVSKEDSIKLFERLCAEDQNNRKDEADMDPAAGMFFVIPLLKFYSSLLMAGAEEERVLIVSSLTLKVSTILKLADEHIARFQRMLDSGSPYVRASECMGYLCLWEDVRARKGKNLDKDQRREIAEAIYCGDYDKLLKECGEKTSEELG